MYHEELKLLKDVYSELLILEKGLSMLHEHFKQLSGNPRTDENINFEEQLEILENMCVGTLTLCGMLERRVTCHINQRLQVNHEIVISTVLDY